MSQLKLSSLQVKAYLYTMALIHASLRVCFIFLIISIHVHAFVSTSISSISSYNYNYQCNKVINNLTCRHYHHSNQLYDIRSARSRRAKLDTLTSTSTSFKLQSQSQNQYRYQYLYEATSILLDTNLYPPGSLIKGKWHELNSMLMAWLTLIQQVGIHSIASYNDNEEDLQGTKENEYKISDSLIMPVTLMETILKRIIDERAAGNTSVLIDIEMYNAVLQAWAAVATSSGSASASSLSTRKYRTSSHNISNQGNELQLCTMSAQRAHDILKHMQTTFEKQQQQIEQRQLHHYGYDHDNDYNFNLHKSNTNTLIQPNQQSFMIILKAWAHIATHNSSNNNHKYNSSSSSSSYYNHNHKQHTKTNLSTQVATRKAHQTLLWMDYLSRSNKNKLATPTIVAYTTVIDSFAKSGDVNAGMKAEQVLKFMLTKNSSSSISSSSSSLLNEHDRVVRPTTYIYNMVIAAYMKSKQHNMVDDVQRLFDQLQEQSQHQHQHQHQLTNVPLQIDPIQPDVISYTSLVSAWAHSNRKRYGAKRAQEILNQMELRYSQQLKQYSKLPSSSSSSSSSLSSPSSSLIRPNTITYNAVLKAWCRSDDPNASKYASSLFHSMHEKYESKTNVDAKPDRVTFNTLLHVLSKNGTDVCMGQAEEILNKMEEYRDNNVLEWSPNLFSYNTVIEGYCKRSDGVSSSNNSNSNSNSNNAKFTDEKKQLDLLLNSSAYKAYTILIKLLKAQKKQIKDRNSLDGVTTSTINMQYSYNNDITPDSFSFNNVIFALSRSGLKQSAMLVEDLIHYMERKYEKSKNLKVRPNVYTYSSAIAAWARSGEFDAGSRAETLLMQMEERYNNGDKALKPNVVTFNSVIDCYAKTKQGTPGARKAEEILEKMERMYHEGDESVKPNVNTYNSVLSAWANSDTKCAHWKSQAVLNKMWNLYEAGNEDVKPDSHAYNTVITAVSKSHLEDKAQLALRLLRKMDILYRRGGRNNKDVRPNEITYTCVLNSCAFSMVDDHNVRRKALDTAIFTLEELMDSPYGKPNHVTYGMFLACCANLIPSDDENRRITVVEPVFLQCCKDGQVGEIVLNQLRLAAPDNLYEKLLGNVVQRSTRNGRIRRVRVEDLPSEWRCNVRNERWKNRNNNRRRKVRHESRSRKKEYNRNR